MNLLAIDIGNSSIKAGIFDGKALTGELCIPSRPARTIAFYRNKIRNFLSAGNVSRPPGGVVLSSVVPLLTARVFASMRDLSTKKPLILDVSLKTGLKFGIRKPEELGGDRIAGLVAATEMFGGTAIVVDFGTATTVSAARNRKYIGGAILPGIRSMAEALHRDASKLPLISVPREESRISPAGKNTYECIVSGIIYGTAGAVESLMEEMESQAGCKFEVAITGGYSDIMTHYLRRKHHRDPHMTLNGLRLIYERNTRWMN